MTTTDVRPAQPFFYPAEVEGYTGPEMCRELYRYACAVERGCIVELGTYKGRTAIVMAQSGHHVHAVDRFRPETEEFHGFPDHHAGRFTAQDVRDNAARFHVDVDVVEGDTAVVGRKWGDSVGLLFIDAGHSYEAVKSDFEAWAPHLTEDAIVIFDDSLWAGVQRFLMELDAWEPVPGPQVGQLTVMRRRRG